MDKKLLWLNLKGYHFDNLVPPHLWDHVREKFGGPDASTKAFAFKIARKSMWKNKFALKAVLEYKKFIYLGVISDFAVTPSKIIDQVWHEHILFSKAYREFCNDIIQYNFDHNPELVPMDDQTATFNAQYLDTINLYKTEFGIDPPAEIWSIPKFNMELITTDGYESKKKTHTSSSNDNTPLYMYFNSSDNASHSNAFPEFSDFGGGSGGGGGADGSWNSMGSHASDHVSDSGSDSSSSSCSSGCGGGGD